jgi:hypothetical protein
VNARPHLTVIPAGYAPDPSGWAHWSWLAQDAARQAWWRLMCAVVSACATTAMREQAWAAGFALALGDRSRHRMLAQVAEYTDGNEAGWDLRHERGGSRRPASAEDGAMAALRSLLGLPVTGPARMAAGAACLFALPAGIIAGGAPRVDDTAGVPLVVPLVVPRRAVISESRYVPRHARRGVAARVARWLRRGVPGLYRQGAHTALGAAA